MIACESCGYEWESRPEELMKVYSTTLGREADVCFICMKTGGYQRDPVKQHINLCMNLLFAFILGRLPMAPGPK